jgi:hypothetical protein
LKALDKDLVATDSTLNKELVKGDSKESHNKNAPFDCIQRELNEQNHTDKP